MCACLRQCGARYRRYFLACTTLPRTVRTCFRCADHLKSETEHAPARLALSLRFWSLSLFLLLLVLLALQGTHTPSRTMDSSPAPGPLDALLLLHARPIASPSTCRANYVHDPVGMALSGAIVVGLLLSYLPAFARIVRHRNSAGYSPLFLLLGATSSASSLGNIVTLQWGQVACCQYLVRARAP